MDGSAHPIYADGGVGPSVVPEVHNERLGLADIQCKAVVLAPIVLLRIVTT